MSSWHVVLIPEKKRKKGIFRTKKIKGYTYTATSADGEYLSGRHVHRDQERALLAVQRRIDHRGGTIADIRVGGAGRPSMSRGGEDDDE